MKKFMLFIVSVFVFTACSSVRNIKIPDNFVELIPAKHKIEKFSNIQQRDGYSCATTSLAMVMAHYDSKPYYKDEVWDASGSSIRRVTKVCGNDMEGLKRAAKHYGFNNYEFVRDLSLNELKYLISKNIPVVVNIRNFYQSSYHAIVVIGYDKEGLYFSDPSYPSFYKKDYKTFLRQWYASLCSPKGKKQRQTAFILYPKTK